MPQRSRTDMTPPTSADESNFPLFHHFARGGVAPNYLVPPPQSKFRGLPQISKGKFPGFVEPARGYPM